MRRYSLGLLLLLSAGCHHKDLSLKARLLKGERLFSVPGACPAPIDASKKGDGYFAFEGEKFVVTGTGKCKSKTTFSAKWLREDRVLLSKPMIVESCNKAAKLDPSVAIIFTFDQIGSNIKLISSQRPDCRWLRWRNG